MKNPPPPDDGQRREYCLFCRAEKVRKVTEDGHDYYECGECGRRAERRIMPEDLRLNYELEEPVWLTLDEALETELSYPVRCVIEEHRGELEGH